jgi:hypothetical protein
VALFTCPREIKQVDRIIRAAPASLIGVQTEEIVIVQVLVKDIVANA